MRLNVHLCDICVRKFVETGFDAVENVNQTENVEFGAFGFGREISRSFITIGGR